MALSTVVEKGGDPLFVWRTNRAIEQLFKTYIVNETQSEEDSVFARPGLPGPDYVARRVRLADEFFEKMKNVFVKEIEAGRVDDTPQLWAYAFRVKILPIMRPYLEELRMRFPILVGLSQNEPTLVAASENALLRLATLESYLAKADRELPQLSEADTNWPYESEIPRTAQSGRANDQSGDGTDPTTEKRGDSSVGTEIMYAPAEQAGRYRVSMILRAENELRQIRPRMESEHNYDLLRAQHPDFIIFQTAERDPELKLLLIGIKGHHQKKALRFAKQVAASACNVALNTIESAWDKYKPHDRRTGKQTKAGSTSNTVSPNARPSTSKSAFKSASKSE